MSLNLFHHCTTVPIADSLFLYLSETGRSEGPGNVSDLKFKALLVIIHDLVFLL